MARGGADVMKVNSGLGAIVASQLVFGFAATQGQGFSPAEAARRMTVPEGLKVTLFASEPMIRQPVAIEFDDRGRLWVIQYLQYPNPSGLKRVKVDRYSRTVYDAVPPPPPKGPRGADRITILEDTDGDGRADSSRDFVGGLNLASGLAFGHGGVFVLQVPYLLFYPDRDRDDVPDGDPEVLLSGFGMEDAHSVANSLTWGPDGWLYGLQGSTVTARIAGQTFQQGVWRYHPATRQFELFCDGGGNMWGLDFDAAGNLFASTNVGGFLTLHAVQGSSCWKQFGKHGPLQNPYAFGYLDHVPHQGAQEGHVAVGGLFYQADAFPERFRNRYIAGDLLGHSVHWNRVTPRGSTFRSSHSGDLLIANDTWFAPTDLVLGPEGSIYVSDWHDRRTAHPDPDADWDRTNGRIFTIEPTSPRRVRGLDLAAKSSRELVDLLDHPNVWYRRKARRLLAERRDRSVLPLLRSLLAKPSGGQLSLEALWTIAEIGGLDSTLALRLLASPDESIRSWIVRLAGDTPALARDLSPRLKELAENDPSLRVQSQLASTAQRLPPAEGLAVAHALLVRPRTEDDPHLPLLLWWAVERHAVAEAELTLKLFATADSWNSRMVREQVIGRLMRRFAAEGSAECDAACARLLASAPTPPHRRTLLVDLDVGMGLRPRGRNERGRHEGLGKILTDSWKAEPDDVLLCRLASRLGSQDARDHALRLALDRRTPEADRLSLLGLWNEPGVIPSIGPLLRLAVGDDLEAIQGAALDVLKRCDDAGVASELLAAYPRKGEKWRSLARDLFLSRKAWAKAFLTAVDRGRVPVAEVSVEQLRAVALHRDPALDALVRKHWGAVKEETPGEKLAEVRRLNNDLRAAEGDARRGRSVYQKHCATCHRLNGEGNLIGPELTHANRTDRDFLLVSLVDPSSVVRKEFQGVIVETRDGRIVTGLVADPTPSNITVVGAKGERTTIDRESIEAIGESSQSLMPDDLYRELSPGDLRDLFKYLQSDGPPSPPR